MSNESIAGEAVRDVLGLLERRDRADKIAEKVARRILRDIVARNVEPGSRLPSEAAMLQRYQIGRASLREALRILEVYGLIRIKPGPGGGPVVTDVSAIEFGGSAAFFFHAVGATLSELVEARVHIEALMARLASERLTDETAAALRQSLEIEAAALAIGTSIADSQSHFFHHTVAGMSGNRVLSLFGQSVVNIYVERARTLSTVDGAAIHNAHRAIGDAILRGQAAQAEQLMREHVQLGADHFLVRFPEHAGEIIDWR